VKVGDEVRIECRQSAEDARYIGSTGSASKSQIVRCECDVSSDGGSQRAGSGVRPRADEVMMTPRCRPSGVEWSRVEQTSTQ
jgi:hypothetical protein